MLILNRFFKKQDSWGLSRINIFHSCETTIPVLYIQCDFAVHYALTSHLHYFLVGRLYFQRFDFTSFFFTIFALLFKAAVLVGREGQHGIDVLCRLQCVHANGG